MMIDIAGLVNQVGLTGEETEILSGQDVLFLTVTFRNTCDRHLL